MNTGKVVGVNRGYIQDGIWIRCQCGNEMLEIIQVPADANDEGVITYQFRNFGYTLDKMLSKNDKYWACFCTDKSGVEQIVDFFAYVVLCPDYMIRNCRILELTDKESKFILKCSIDDSPINEMTLINTKGKIVWQSLINDKDIPELIDSLKNMIKNDNSEVQNG